MKKNEKLVLRRNVPVKIDRFGNTLEYLEIDEQKETLSLLYNYSCTISIPLERRDVQIKKYRYQLEEPSQDTVILKSLGMNRKPIPKGNPYKS